MNARLVWNFFEGNATVFCATGQILHSLLTGTLCTAEWVLQFRGISTFCVAEWILLFCGIVA
jgi:hypothetical protein